jgi:hypothetical protein
MVVIIGLNLVWPGPNIWTEPDISPDAYICHGCANLKFFLHFLFCYIQFLLICHFFAAYGLVRHLP